MKEYLRNLWGMISITGVAILVIVGAGVVTAATIQEEEPNDDFETAQVISEGDVAAEIEGGESDFYRVKANTTDALDVAVNPEDGDVYLRIYNTEREQIAETTIWGGRGQLVRKVPNSGTYYIEVAGQKEGTTTDYTLDYDKITPAENDDFAPNDDFSSAAPITKQFTDAKIWGGESDFYRVKANTTDALDLSRSEYLKPA